MHPPLFVRPLTDDEREQLKAGLRSPAAFTLRRCQIVLLSAEKRHARAIAAQLGCSDETVRKVIRAFCHRGCAALVPRSRRPHTSAAAFDAAATERLIHLVHQSPRDLGYPTSVWTLPLLAQQCVRSGITAHQVSGETIRATLVRHGIRWQRAKRWIRSPDPAYAQKNDDGTE